MRSKKFCMLIGLLTLFVTMSMASEISQKTSAEEFTKRDILQQVDISSAVRLDLVSGREVYIEDEGIYLLDGSYKDTVVIIDAGKTAKVQLLLNNLTIANKDIPAIFIKSSDKVFITTLQGNSSLGVSGKYKANKDDNLDAVIYSKSDLVLNGVGRLDILSKYGNGIASKDDLKVTGGAIHIDSLKDGLEANDSIRIYNGEITIDSGKDAIHSENEDDSSRGYIYIKNGTLNIVADDDAITGSSIVQIDGGTINITSCQEGIEGNQVLLNGGDINIYATDDGINAADKVNLKVLIEVYGGNVTVKMAGGDTDAFDANGDIFIYGGVIDVTGGSTFDADGTAKLINGSVTINGQLVSELPANRQGHHKRG